MNFRLIEKLFHKTNEMAQKKLKVMTEMHLSILADDMSPKKAKKVMTTANA